MSPVDPGFRGRKLGCEGGFVYWSIKLGDMTSYDQQDAKKWWDSLTNEMKFNYLDQTVIFFKERNLNVIRDRDILFLFRRFIKK